MFRPQSFGQGKAIHKKDASVRDGPESIISCGDYRSWGFHSYASGAVGVTTKIEVISVPILQHVGYLMLSVIMLLCCDVKLAYCIQHIFVSLKV